MLKVKHVLIGFAGSGSSAQPMVGSSPQWSTRFYPPQLCPFISSLTSISEDQNSVAFSVTSFVSSVILCG